MLIKVIKANYIKDHQIELTFNDGLQTVVDLTSHLKGEIFKPLINKDYFSKFSLNPWTVQWQNGADFAPEFLDELAIKQSKSIHTK